MAAGAFKIRYPVFAASVAISTAIWAGVVMVVGVNFGPRMEASLRPHREIVLLWAVLVVVMVLFIVRRRHPAVPASSSDPQKT